MKLVNLFSHSIKLVLTLFLTTQIVVAADLPFSVTSTTKVSTPNSKGTSGTSDDLLDPKDAFKPQLRQRDAFTGELKFDIASGYYLYKDRLRVEYVNVPSDKKPPNKTASKKLAVAQPQALALSKPDGKPIDDPTFGKVEVYETTATALIDLTRFDRTKAADLEFAVVSQGCAKVGVCFPPQRHVLLLKYKPTSSGAGSWQLPKSSDAISFGQSGLPAALSVKPASPQSNPTPKAKP
jgi:thioredoxin:protein disulfide reductase